MVIVVYIIVQTMITTGNMSSLMQGLLVPMCTYSIVAIGLNLCVGYLGELSIGHAGFMCVGAFSSAFCTKLLQDSIQNEVVLFLIAIAVGTVAAAFFGFLIGIPVLRLRGDYLAIITLGFGEIIRVVLTNIDSVLGFDFTYGAAGLKRIPKFSSVTLVFICVVLSCFFIHTMMKSKHGRAILSIRDNEIASESVGVNTTYYKTMAFVFSAMLAGIAGCLYAGYLGSLYPSTFKFMKSIEILVIVVLGGMGSMLGSIVSATVLTVLPELLRSVADYRMVAYSLALVIMMIFRPKGLFGSYDFSMSRVLEKGLNFVFRPELRSRQEEQNDEQN